MSRKKNNSPYFRRFFELLKKSKDGYGLLKLFILPLKKLPLSVAYQNWKISQFLPFKKTTYKSKIISTYSHDIS